MVIATVPANVPSPKISAAIVAMMMVGKVLTRPKRKRTTDRLMRFLLILELEIIEIGNARIHPMIVPKSDILIVSISGPKTLGKKSIFG